MPPLENVALVLMRLGIELNVSAKLVAGGFEFIESVQDGPWFVMFIGHNDARFPLGKMTVLRGKCSRAFGAEESVDTEMESTAIARLRTILRTGNADASVRLTSSGEPGIWGKLRPIESATASDFFMTTLETPVNGNIAPQVKMQLEFTGVAFRFDASLLEESEGLAAWRLPTRASRLVRRTAPRFPLSWPVEVTCLGETEEKFQSSICDLSPLGCGLRDADIHLRAYQQIELRFLPFDRAPIVARAIVLERSTADRAGCIFATNAPGAKEAFLQLHASTVVGLSLSQRASDAWDCLEERGYLDLLEGGQLRTVRDACLEAWQETDACIETFQPVAQAHGVRVGTIAAAQVSSDHWIPHSFATAVERKHLRISESLYQSWPLYMLAQGAPSWFSTWYDSDKPWHNRFYQVFIQEHEGSSLCLSFVRRWFWCPDLQAIPVDDPGVSLRPLDPNTDTVLVDQWKDRYLQRDAPPTRLREEAFFAFHTVPLVVLLDGKAVAICPTTTSTLEMNPFGVFNVSHLNLFDPETRMDPPAVQRIVRKIGNELKRQGKVRTALSMDYDCEVEISTCGFIRFTDARCLSAMSDLIGDLISNNALCFADMRARHK